MRDLIFKTDFAKLWISQILTQVGLNFINFVLVLRIFEKTQSTFAVSLVWLFYSLPAIILGPFAGTVIDLASRRKLLILTTVSQAIIVLFYLLIKDSVWPLYAVLFISAFANQLYVPAEAATLPFLVKKGSLALANGLFLFTIYASILVGYGAAGPIVAVSGRRTPFIIVSIMLVLAAISVFRLRGDKKGKNITTPEEFWKRFHEGYNFIRKNPSVLLPILLLVLSGIIVPVIGVSAPAIATNILDINFLEVSTRMIIPLGLGAIIGGFLSIKLLNGGRKKPIIVTGLFLGALSFLFMGSILVYLDHKAILGSVASFFMGTSLAMTVIPAQTFLQEQTPDSFRGRVFGVLNFSIVAASFIPIMSLAALTEFFGERAILVWLSIILFVAGVAAMKFEYFLKRLYAK